MRTLTYDARANLTGVTDETGKLMTFAWDERGSPVSFADGDGQVTRFTTDAFGNIISKIDPLGRTISYTYDGMGRVRTMTDPRGPTRYEYDALGRVLKVTDPLNNETRTAYDGNGNKVEMIDARQQITSYEYDARNRLTKVTFPDGTTRRYTYNFRDQMTSETDQLDRTTRYEHDDAGQLVKVIRPDNAELTFTYDGAGRIKSATDERGKTSTYEYDPNCGCSNRMTKVTTSDGKSSTYRFDDAGRRVAFVDAEGRETLYTYDTRSNLIRTNFPDGTFTQATYDGANRAVTTTDQEGRVTRYSYDGAGNVKSVTDAKGQATQYEYDALDNLAAVTNANGRTTRFEYDALNRVTKRVLPLGMSDSYTYDQVGNLATKTDFRGKQTSYEYDPLNRLTAKRPDASLGEPSVTFAYTATGRRRTMTDASGTTNYTYDDRDRMLTKATPQGTLTYTYDAADNLASMRSSNADGVAVNYTYDDRGRLETVLDQRLGGAETRYTYDAVGNLKSDQRSNGVRTDYNYDALNRLSNMTTGRAGTTIAGYAYTLDRTGRRLSSTELGGRTVTYTYDELYRLTRESVAGNPDPTGNGAVDYGYDAVGNRLSRISNLPGVPSASSGFDANDRSTTEAYDANGNTRTTGGRTYAYDFEDRVRSADGGAVRVVYDGDGNLAAKTAGGVTTRFLVDVLNPTGYSQVVEETVGGQVVRQYTYGNTIVSQRQQLGGVWSASFYSFDGHGSVRQLTDSAGAVTDTYAYDAFGKLLDQTGSTPNAYLYAGERYDADLGLYHLRARHYNPDRGRFTSMDPFAGYIEEPMSLHKYLYVNADPVNLIDPSGLSSAYETTILSRILMATRPVLSRLSKSIQCIFLKAASWLAAAHSVPSWIAVQILARSLGLLHCVCKLGNVPPARGPLRDWLRDAPDLLQEAWNWYNNWPEWQGMNPDRTPVEYVPQDEVARRRHLPGAQDGRGGHHPHPLSLGGPPVQNLTPNGPRHNAVTGLGRRISNVIKAFCTP